MATSRLNPYIGFEGNAREAMEFYRSVFGGQLRMNTHGDFGNPDPALKDKVMHGQLETEAGYTLMGSDSISGSPGEAPAGIQISLSGEAESDAELSGYYNKIAAAGTVVELLVEAPWGDKFGMVTDPYGILWMVNIAGQRDEQGRG